jgi:hypothetical protein
LSGGKERIIKQSGFSTSKANIGGWIAQYAIHPFLLSVSIGLKIPIYLSVRQKASTGNEEIEKTILLVDNSYPTQ